MEFNQVNKNKGSVNNVLVLRRPDCNHPESMIVTTAGSGTRFCWVCDLQDRWGDAETRERELIKERDKLKRLMLEIDHELLHENPDLTQLRIFAREGLKK